MGLKHKKYYSSSFMNYYHYLCFNYKLIIKKYSNSRKIYIKYL